MCNCVCSYRCDGNNDCKDASDEFYCTKISVSDSYLNEVPAPPLNGNRLTDITINIEIIEVLSKTTTPQIVYKVAL